MSMAVEMIMEHMVETKGAEDHDHDLIHELNRRPDAPWRYDAPTANAGNKPQLQQFWDELKTPEQKNIQRPRQFVANHCAKGCF